MGTLETLGLTILILGSTFVLGVWVGGKMADDEWREIIDYMRKHPQITKDQLDLIFRLDQRK